MCIVNEVQYYPQKGYNPPLTILVIVFCINSKLNNEALSFKTVNLTINILHSLKHTRFRVSVIEIDIPTFTIITLGIKDFWSRKFCFVF